MPRHPEPRWRDKLGCYVYNFRCRRHYLRGIAKGDGAAVRAAVERIKAEADAAALALREPTARMLGEWFLRWSARHNTYRTTADHDAMIRRFCAFGSPPYGDRPARTITATDLARMRQEWEKAGYGAAYVQRLYKSVLACWAWAARPEPDRGDGLPEKLLDSNPLAGMRRPRGPARAERYATRKELADLLRAGWREANRPWRTGTRGRCLACTRAGREGPCRRSHAATARMDRDSVLLVRLLRATGARPSELCKATWADWSPHVAQDPETGHWWGLIRLSPERHKTGRSTGRPRRIAVPPLLARALERIRARKATIGRENGDKAAIFTHRRARGSEARGAVDAGAGEPWTVGALGHRFRRWRQGVPPELRSPSLTLYTLRHTWYTDAAPVVGAEAAGQAGGTSGAIVRQVYLAGRDETVIQTARAARARRR